MSSRHVLKTSSRHVFKKSSRHVFKSSSRHVFKTCLQHVFSVTIFRLLRLLKDVLKTSWKTKNCYVEDVLKTSSRHVLKTSSRRLKTNKCLLGLFPQSSFICSRGVKRLIISRYFWLFQGLTKIVVNFKIALGTRLSGTWKLHVESSKSCIVNFAISPSQVFLKGYEQISPEQLFCNEPFSQGRQNTF